MLPSESGWTTRDRCHIDFPRLLRWLLDNNLKWTILSVSITRYLIRPSNSPHHKWLHTPGNLYHLDRMHFRHNNWTAMNPFFRQMRHQFCIRMFPSNLTPEPCNEVRGLDWKVVCPSSMWQREEVLRWLCSSVGSCLPFGQSTLGTSSRNERPLNYRECI